jgi:hypothetical protein
MKAHDDLRSREPTAAAHLFGRSVLDTETALAAQ